MCTRNFLLFFALVWEFKVTCKKSQFWTKMSISLMRPVMHLVFKLRCLTTDHVARMGRNVLLFSILLGCPLPGVVSRLSYPRISHSRLSAATPYLIHCASQRKSFPLSGLFTLATIHAAAHSAPEYIPRGGRLDRISRGGGDNSWAWRAGGRYWINQDQGFLSTLWHKYF